MPILSFVTTLIDLLSVYRQCKMNICLCGRKNLKNGKRRGQRKQKRKGAYDKSGGSTRDTAGFAVSLKIYLKSEAVPDWNRVRIIIIWCG